MGVQSIEVLSSAQLYDRGLSIYLVYVEDSEGTFRYTRGYMNESTKGLLYPLCMWENHAVPGM